MNGTSLVITFNEDLAVAACLANGAFTVKKKPTGAGDGHGRGAVRRRRRDPPETGSCALDLTAEFRDGNGDLAGVYGLTPPHFTVANGSVSLPAEVDNRRTWTVPAQATAGFTGPMRVSLATSEDWEAAKLVVQVAGDTECSAMVAQNALASLALDGLALDPAFDAGTTASTAAATGEVTVTAAAVYGTAAVSILPADAEADGHQVALAAGGADVAAQVYTVTMTRGAADSDGTRAGAVALDSAAAAWAAG